MADIPAVKQILADNLRSLRESHGFTLAQVGENVGAQKTTIGRIEDRDHEQFPGPELIDRLAHFYQVKHADLFRIHGVAEKNFSIVATLDTALQIVNKYAAEGGLEMIRKRRKSS